MTRKEFSANFDAYMRSGSRSGIWIACPCVALIFGILFLSDLIEKHYGVDVSNVFNFSMLFVSLGGIVISAILLNAALIKKFGLQCPTCGCALAREDRRRKALLTGNCPKCGN